MAERSYATLTAADIGVLAGYFVLVILIGVLVSHVTPSPPPPPPAFLRHLGSNIPASVVCGLVSLCPGESLRLWPGESVSWW